MFNKVFIPTALLLGVFALVACSDAVEPIPGNTTSSDGGISTNNNTSDAGTP